MGGNGIPQRGPMPNLWPFPTHGSGAPDLPQQKQQQKQQQQKGLGQGGMSQLGMRMLSSWQR
jgi:hypothetical protein